MFHTAVAADWQLAFESAFREAFGRRVGMLLVGWEWTLEAGITAVRAENRRTRRVTRLVLPRNTLLLDPEDVADRAAGQLYLMLRQPIGPPSIAFL